MINIKYDKPNKLNNIKQSAYVNFEYKLNIVNTIRMIFPRHYDVETKIWEIPYDYVQYLLDNLKDEQFNIIGKTIKN